MAELKLGYLFKRKYVTYEEIKYEIYEFIDYVCGIVFINSNHNYVCNVISGENMGINASIFNSNVNSEYTFLSEELNDVIKNNNNYANYQEIRNNKIKNTSRYYKNIDNKLILIKDKKLIEYIESKNKLDIDKMYKEIKKTIISQDEQIKEILSTLYKNNIIVNSNMDNDLINKLKENILVYGSSGSGKTEIIKIISKLFRVPMVIEDATTLSETGYVGRKVSDMLEDLYINANKNIEYAERGILVIDEFDKLAERDNNQSHVSRSGVQRSLLKLLDGHTFYFDNIKFDTSKLTIMFLGAFNGIRNDNNYGEVKTEDFINYGIMRELMGRLSKSIPMNTLKKEDIIKILKQSNYSPINTYSKLFDMLGVKYNFSEDFIKYIANKAMEKNTGARSLKTVFDETVSSALFQIFAYNYDEISLVDPINNDNKAYILSKRNKSNF